MGQGDRNTNPGAQIPMKTYSCIIDGKLTNTNDIHRNLDGKRRMNKWAGRKEMYSIQRRIRRWTNCNSEPRHHLMYKYAFRLILHVYQNGGKIKTALVQDKASKTAVYQVKTM
jgi:hypothetical protein